MLSLIFTCLHISAASMFETNPTWSDEFNYHGFPNADIWEVSQIKQSEHLVNYVKQENTCYAHGRNLHLTLLKDSDFKYISGRIVANKSHRIKYGKLQIRAKCSTVKGAWEAIWLKSSANSAASIRGEIDLMEYIGDWGREKFQTNFHLRGFFSGRTNNHQQYQKFPQVDISKWHVYTLEWYKDSIRVYVDDKLHYNLHKGDIPEWPFDIEYTPIIAFGYGPNWSRTKELDDAALPQTLKIDYVRYYKLKE